MYKLLKSILLPICMFFLVSACKEKKPAEQPEPIKQVEVTVDPMYELQYLQDDETVFVTEEGYRVKLREFKFYVTDVRNGEHLVTDAALFDWSKGKTLLKVPGDAANLGALALNIGVPAALNHSDPAAFANDHALNILTANDMHWSWNPGYIFAKVEMLADTLDDGIALFDKIVSYHIGMDDAFQSATFSNLSWQTSSAHLSQLRLKFDLSTFLRNGTSIVDIKTESGTHSEPENMPLTLKLATNFKAALQKL